MAVTTPQFDFLIEYVLALLEANDVILDDAQKQVYVPQIAGQASMRLGLVLMPKLNEQQQKQLTVLMNNNASAKEWLGFWKASVPTFEDDVKNVLLEFTDKVKPILSKE